MPNTPCISSVLRKIGCTNVTNAVQASALQTGVITKGLSDGKNLIRLQPMWAWLFGVVAFLGWFPLGRQSYICRSPQTCPHKELRRIVHVSQFSSFTFHLERAVLFYPTHVTRNKGEGRYLQSFQGILHGLVQVRGWHERHWLRRLSDGRWAYNCCSGCLSVVLREQRCESA